GIALFHGPEGYYAPSKAATGCVPARCPADAGWQGGRRFRRRWPHVSGAARPHVARSLRGRPEPWDASGDPLARPGPSRHRIPERASPRWPPPRPLRLGHRPPSATGRPLGPGLLASGPAARPGGGDLLLPRDLHDDRLRGHRPRAWLARAG